MPPSHKSFLFILVKRLGSERERGRGRQTDRQTDGNQGQESSVPPTTQALTGSPTGPPVPPLPRPDVRPSVLQSRAHLETPMLPGNRGPSHSPEPTSHAQCQTHGCMTRTDLCVRQDGCRACEGRPARTDKSVVTTRLGLDPESHQASPGVPRRALRAGGHSSQGAGVPGLGHPHWIPRSRP